MNPEGRGSGSRDSGAGRATLVSRALYCAGHVSTAVKLILFGLYTLQLYTTVMGLPATLVGVASAMGLVWDAVVDPYIGHLSDRFRGSLGRRHSFMLVGALTMGIGFWAYLSPPRGLETWELFAWLLVTSLFVRTAISIYEIPYLALGAELTRDYDERTTITAARALAALLGTMITAALSFVLFFPEGQAGADPKLDYQGYPRMGLTYGAVMTAIGLAATLGTLSWRPFLARKAAEERATGSMAGFLESVARSLRVPSFRSLFAASSLFFLAVVINFALSIHFLTHHAGITASSALMWFQVAFYTGGLAGVTFWMRVSRRAEKHRVFITGMVSTAVVMLVSYLLIGEGRPLGTGNIPAVLAGHALGGFFGSILWFMPYSMIADIADEDEARTGERREGSFFGMLSIGQQLATGVSVLIAGILVDHFAGLVPGQAEQSATTSHRIALLYGVLPAVITLAACLAAMRYSLVRSQVRAIQAERS